MTHQKSHPLTAQNDHEANALLMRLAEYEEKGEATPEEQPALDHLLNELESFVEILQTPLPLDDQKYLDEEGCRRATYGSLVSARPHAASRQDYDVRPDRWSDYRALLHSAISRISSVDSVRRDQVPLRA